MHFIPLHRQFLMSLEWAAGSGSDGRELPSTWKNNEAQSKAPPGKGTRLLGQTWLPLRRIHQVYLQPQGQKTDRIGVLWLGLPGI
jgi:hypothetical protein